MEDSKTIHRSLMIMQVSKKSGAYCDHAKGIADMVTYMVTGESVRHQSCVSDEKEPAWNAIFFLKYYSAIWLLSVVIFYSGSID